MDLVVWPFRILIFTYIIRDKERIDSNQDRKKELKFILDLKSSLRSLNK